MEGIWKMKIPLNQSRLYAAILIAGAAALPVLPTLHALPCTTQSQMQPDQRQKLSAIALDYARLAQQGDRATLRARMLPAVVDSFDGIAGAILAGAPQLKANQPQIHSLYLLDATTLTAGTDAIFDCFLNSNALGVTFNISQLTPGRYLVVFLRFEGDRDPQQMILILGQNNFAPNIWQLGGLFLRPLTLAGQNGVWYWQQARSAVAAGQLWSAQLYFAAAGQLLVPVHIFTSPNLEKLESEAAAARQKDFPGPDAAAAPVELHQGTQLWKLRMAALDEPETAGTEPDLTLEYTVDRIAEPVAARADCIALAAAVLSAHPEIRALFHGLRVRAVTSRGEEFAIRLEGKEIP